MTFHNASRKQESILAGWERSCLIWLARRTPPWIGSDHLTLLGFAGMFLAGASYASARWWPPGLLLAGLCLGVNWLGDSLDGTLARERGKQRPRYGFYVDHMVDAFGALFLLGGLALSGFMSERVALALLVSFLLLAIDSYLATYTRGVFRLSFWMFGPTEMRLLLVIGNAMAFAHPVVTFLGRQMLFFDAGGLVAVVCMNVVLLFSVVRNTVALYREERIS